MDNEERMHKLQNGSDTAQWAAKELTTLRAELDNIKTSWALLHAENEQLRAYKAECEKAEPVFWLWKTTSGKFNNGLFQSAEKAKSQRESFYAGEAVAVYTHPIPSDRVADRITEQDAREIGASVFAYCRKRIAEHWGLDSWLNNHGGRTLLNKLNADREQVPAVAVPGCLKHFVDHDFHQLPVYDDGRTPLCLTEEQYNAIKSLVAAPSHSQQNSDIEGFKLIPDLPHGFNHSAYNRHTGEWVYLNHANTWQLFQGPLTDRCPSHEYDRTVKVVTP